MTKGMSVKQSYSLLKSFQLNELNFARLQYSVTHFVISTLQNYYTDRLFTPSKNFLEEYDDEILGLPNITPNGLFLPKKSTRNAFNDVHRAAASMFNSTGLAKHFSSAHMPISIRLITNKRAGDLDARPRSSTKLHTDIWAGESAATMMLFLPLMGDAANNSISFYEMDSFPVELLRSLTDFKYGGELARKSCQLDVDFNIGELYLADSFILHKTEKKSPKIRLSLEFRLVPKQVLASDGYGSKARESDYVCLDKWFEIGEDLFVYNELPLRDYSYSDKVIDKYAGSAKLIDLRLLDS